MLLQTLFNKDTAKCFFKDLTGIFCFQKCSWSLNFSQMWAAPPFPLCFVFWKTRVHQQHTQNLFLLFFFFFVYILCVLTMLFRVNTLIQNLIRISIWYGFGTQLKSHIWMFINCAPWNLTFSVKCHVMNNILMFSVFEACFFMLRIRCQIGKSVS